MGFFCQLQLKFPRVAERRPAGDRVAPRGAPADGLIAPDIGQTSADHPANVNCELNLPDDCRMSAGWVLYQRITAGFLQDSSHGSPCADPAIDFALL